MLHDPTTRARVLVLEDDPELRETLAELLEDEGYYVVAVGRGEEAVRRAGAESFDLIVSDIRMDGMDGLEAIDRTRQLQPGMSSLVVSGYASEHETLRAIHLNVGGYLRKPFSMKDFLVAVKGILDKRLAQLRFQREVEGYRGAFAWAMHTLAELCDEHGFPSPEGGLLQATRIGEALARKLGLSPEVAQRVGWAIQLAVLSGQSNLGGLAGGAGELAQASSFLARLLQMSASPQERRASLEQEVVALGHAVWQHWTREGSLPTWEEAQAHESLEKGYREVVESAAGLGAKGLNLEVLRALAGPDGRDSGLLALAGALEQANDWGAAAHAYRQVFERTRSEPDSLTAQACLGLARLGKRQGNSKATEEWTAQLRSLQARPGLGLVEAGLLLSDIRPPMAKEFLTQAVTELTRQGLPLQAGKARFALLGVGGEVDERQLRSDAQAMLEPAFHSDLAQGWGWLLPELLRRVDPPEQRPLFRLLLDFSLEVAELLKAGRLGVEARHNTLRCLESQEFAVPEELLQALLRDEQVELRQRAGQLQNRNRGDLAPVSLRLQSFGPFQVLCGSRILKESEWRTQKIKYLLAYLAGAGDRRVGEDELLDEFWPETRGPSKRNLYVATTALRRALRPHPQAKEVDYIVRERGSLFLNQALPVWHDATECEAASREWVAAERQGQVEAMAEHCRRIATFYTGPYLQGCYMEWAVRRRASWEERATQALTRLAQHTHKLRQPREALELATRALEVDPGHQEAHVVKMRCYLALRQPEAVIRHFEAMEKLLRREYEMEPTMEMLEIHTRARHGIFESDP